MYYTFLKLEVDDSKLERGENKLEVFIIFINQVINTFYQDKKSVI